jgi:hypothetical protein
MKSIFIAVLLFGTAAVHARKVVLEEVEPTASEPGKALEVPATDTDLIRFTNADQLNGRFTGIKPGPLVLWQRDDVAAPVEFKTNQLRQVVLRNGNAAKSLPDHSIVGLVNGDRIPGTLTSIDERQLTLETSFAGTIILPRDVVAMAGPNPVGGRIHYAGPFSPEGWVVVGNTGALASGENLPNEGDPNPEPTKSLPGWSFAGGAWYNRVTSSVLKRDVRMPERAIVRFQLAWKNRLALALAFHADFKTPEKPADGEDPKQVDTGVQSYARHFGNAYVLNLYPNYVVLYRSSYDNEGKPVVDRIQAGGTNIRLPDTGEATVELRCNRRSGEIVLYLNGEFATQWTEQANDLDAASCVGIGFIPTGGSVKISELMVADWNGMPDSARSMQSDDQDVVLLANGTDRFAGQVTGFSDGKLRVKARYGEFQFPLDEVSEVRFARNRLAKAEASGTGSMRVRFPSLGSISGVPEAGDRRRLSFSSTLAGKLDLDLDYAVMFDFKNANSFVDDWDPPF